MPYKFGYDKNGEIRAPATADSPMGTLLALVSLLFALVPHLPISNQALHPLVIQYLPSFWTLRRAGLISDGDLALMEIATGVWLVAKCVQFVAYRRTLSASFSEANPPPLALKDRWPLQFFNLAAIGLVAMIVSFAMAPLLYVLGALSARYAFYVVTLFGGGCMMLSEGAASFVLYRTFKARFWPGLESGFL